jgi:hypothetical protein
MRQFLNCLRQHGQPLSEANFSCYADHSVARWALVRQGMGIGAMVDEIALDTRGIARVLDDVPPVRFPIWLVTTENCGPRAAFGWCSRRWRRAWFRAIFGADEATNLLFGCMNTRCAGSQGAAPSRAVQNWSKTDVLA